MTTANTKDCLRECIGHTVRGVLFHAFDGEHGTQALVLDDGRAIVFCDTGGFWMENAEAVKRAIASVRDSLQRAHADLADLLVVAGAPRKEHP